jgi:glycosyltransferase involved in cell wall biosynthesis
VLAFLSEDTSLTFVGDGPWRERVAQAAVTQGFADRVRCLGSRDDIGDLMRAAHLLLVTSDTDGIPGVVLEAQHLGLPIVTFDIGGLKESVISGVTGWLVPHGDVHAMAETVTRVKSFFGQELSRRCHGFAERFSIEAVGPRYVEFFSVQLGRRGHPKSTRPDRAAG